MTINVNYSIYFGAAGWRHAHWTNVFYPEALPEDWELSFYNSQFRCVYLSPSDWDGCSSMIQNWLADTQDTFRFVLDTAGCGEQITNDIREALGHRAVRYPDDFTSSKLIWIAEEPNLRQLKDEINQAVDEGYDLYLLNREGCLPAIEKVKTLVELMGY